MEGATLDLGYRREERVMEEGERGDAQVGGKSGQRGN